MKTIKKTLALVLALVMVLALSANVFAYTVTINPNPSDTASHTYSAYQLFTGDVVEEGGHKVLSNIAWGANVDQSKLGDLATAINALRDTTADGYVALTAASSADDFADALSELNASADDTTAQAVADAFGAVLTGTPVVTNASPLSIDTAGYYIIKDSDAPVTGNAAKTRYILQVVGNVNVGAKSEVPSVDKKINEDGGVKVNEASIGEVVPFIITSKVPDMAGYDSYYFIVKDTMDAGLQFLNNVVVKVAGTTLTQGTAPIAGQPLGDGVGYYVEDYKDPDTGVTSIKIVFHNFIQYANQKDADIEITYSARLDTDAVIAPLHNDNTAELLFSNDPNYEYHGKQINDDDDNPEYNPDEPGAGPDGTPEPTGVTPKSTTETYTTELTVTKVDEEGNILTGAEFTLEGSAVKTVLVTTDAYTENASGEYWKLKDGSYTTDDPAEHDPDLYESTTTKYAKTSTTTPIVSSETVKVKGVVGDDGKVTFTGLGAGQYTLTETQTPAGYNTVSPITFTVTFNPSTKVFTSTSPVTANDSKLSTTVVNQKGNTLPSTGGMGTTIFYVLGSLMALGACVVLISRKRIGAAA